MAEVDWYSEVTQPTAAPAAQPTGAAAIPKTDWYGEVAGVKPRAEGSAPMRGRALPWNPTPEPAPEPEPGAIYHPDRAASMGHVAIASLAEDPLVRARYYAKARGMDPAKYQIVNGSPAYPGDDGKMYFEEPSGHYFPRSLTEAGGMVADKVGPAIPFVAGGATGLLTAPLMLTGPGGVAASVGATGGAAATAEAARQTFAKLLLGQDYHPGSIVTEGLTAGVGQGVGAGLTKLAQRHVAQDIGRLSAQDTTKLRDLAAREGIDLTPAELTNLASLRAQQKYLGNATRSQDTMQDFYEQRAGQVDTAINRFLERVSPVDSGEVAGEMARGAANRAVDTATANRAAQASPIYQRAFAANPTVEVQPIIDAIDKQITDGARGPIKSALEKARGLLFREVPDEAGTGTMSVPDWELKGLHQAKIALDDLIEGTGENAVGRGAKAQLVGVKNQLLKAMDQASPDYQSARAIYGDLSPGIERIKEGVTGRLADMGETQLGKAAQMLFGANSGPRAIAEAKAQLEAASPEAWQALKRTWIQDVFERSAQEYASNYGNVPNVAGKFTAALRGNPQTMARLKAALSPEEFAAMSDLTDVLKAASRVKPIGSDTEFNRLITEAERAKARPFMAKVVGNLNPAQAMRSFDDWLTNRAMGNNAEKLAQIITQPGAAETLKSLRIMSPKSAAYRVAVGRLLTSGVETGAEAVVD